MTENVEKSKVVLTLEKWYEATGTIHTEWFSRALKNSLGKKKVPPDSRFMEFIAKLRELRIQTYEVLTEESESQRTDELRDLREQLARQEKLTEEVMEALNHQNEHLLDLNRELEHDVEELNKRNEDYEEEIKALSSQQLDQETMIENYRDQLSQLQGWPAEYRRLIAPVASRNLMNLNYVAEYQQQVVQEDVNGAIYNNEEMVFSTNWEDLTPDLKGKIIDYLDFKNRLNLRGTSRSIRATVDSHRYMFDKVYLFAKDNLITTWKHSKCTNYKLSESHNALYSTQEIERISSLVKLIVYILKNCNIKSFYVKELSGIDQSLLRDIEEVIQPQTVRIKHFHAEQLMSTTQFFLKKCWRRLESVVIDDPHFLVDSLIECPPVNSAKCLQVNCDVYHHQLLVLIEKFVERNAPIGAKIRIQCNDTKLWREWLAYCDPMLIANKDANQFLMRTHNDEKQAAIILDSNFLFEISIVPIQVVAPLL
uniref:F-box domain-containing protein n=1 Tax=Caenorhabditis tropicalis TaxID=1561998 RepID=A0A1I7UFG2_9PELO